MEYGLLGLDLSERSISLQNLVIPDLESTVFCVGPGSGNSLADALRTSGEDLL